MLGMAVSTLFPSNQSASNVKALDTWNKNAQRISRPLGKVRPIAATLSDTEPEDDSNNEGDGISNALTTTINPTEGIVEEVDEEEDSVESKFEKIDE